MRITPVEFNGGEHYRSASISLIRERGEQMSALVLLTGSGQSREVRRDGVQIILSTVNLDLLDLLETTKDPTEMFRPALQSPRGMNFCVYQALKGVSTSLCYSEPETDRLLGNVTIPNGIFIANKLH